jgi:hypothetical protein
VSVYHFNLFFGNVTIQVSKTANDLVCHLLDSQLFMTEELWEEFLTSLHKSIPLIQVNIIFILINV